MMHHTRYITDWNAAYANAPNIPGGDEYPERWARLAAEFRDRADARLDVPYGDGERHRYDLFKPTDTPRGLIVFVHGGYWIRFSKSFFSHLAAGPLAHGWAVAMPSYTLAPHARIASIAREIARAIDHAAEAVPGPIRLVGHSAGGHLVTRAVSSFNGSREKALLPGRSLERIERVISISGVHDLRPIMRIEQNGSIQLEWNEAVTESPALLAPTDGLATTVWVGATERAEFVRQSELLANVWTGLGARITYVAEPDRHHFDVIDGLADAESPLTRAVAGTPM